MAAVLLKAGDEKSQREQDGSHPRGKPVLLHRVIQLERGLSCEQLHG